MPTYRLFSLIFLAISSWLTATAQTSELPLHLFSYDKTAPLAFTDSLIGTQQGVHIHKVSYASPVKGRVSGLLFIPSVKGPFAGILLQHGAPGTAMNQTPRGVYLARHGAVVLATNAPFAERGGDPIQFTPADSVEQVTYMINLQRAVDLLISRPDVDPNRLGYVGRSHGGAMGALFAGIERRLKTYILVVADGGLIAHFSSEKGELSDQVPLTCEQRKRWIAAMQPIEPIRYIHRAAPASLFMQSARQDEAVSTFAAEQLQKAAPANKVIKWYDAGHRLNTQSYIDQLAWFHDQLGTTAPGPDDQKGPDFPDAAAPKKNP
ncbi:alpha/beta hydrolase [Spirosoma validum]|uniref:Acetylxylan esterase n=1 Tax=Spirosoma validum TaxID=2771355 RepID=A0A927B451_9BACT|nr:prolyl oligopeptidase family serine peptidase [Spirosoma validum]MBD2754968.1 acetylxylan esterase [Spirosoma validum]